MADMTRWWRWIAVCGMLALAGEIRAQETPRHVLAIEQGKFTINGKPTFLLGCSYYGALGASDATWKADLDDLQNHGINWIRVWVTWRAFGDDVSALDGATGKPREKYLRRLQQLVAECDRRGIIVDVTISRGNGVTGPSRLQDLATHQAAVETLLEALAKHRNWYLDLSNERNIQDSRFTSFDDLKRLRARVRELNKELLVTASHGGDMSENDVERYVRDVGVDFLTPHRPRHAESPGETEAVTRRLIARMKELGRVVPVHYQEPFRRAYAYQPGVKDFETDLRGAIAGGAAGWCFHNGDTREADDGRPRRSFDLREKRLFDQLDDVERDVLHRIGKLMQREAP